MPRSCYHCPRAGSGKLRFSFVRITALLVSSRPEIAQCQNYAYMLNAALMLFLCPRAGTGKLGFSFVRIPALLVSCRPNSAQCQNHALMLNAALIFSSSTCRYRQAWFLFCPHHGAAGLLHSPLVGDRQRCHNQAGFIFELNIVEIIPTYN
jgi:hypothetical protein